jgi:predicted RNA-binding Zn ribbon-like protein
MPEHRHATPAAWRDLESFLWHDFPAPAAGWAEWVARKMPSLPADAAPASTADAMALHAALRALQAANNGIPSDTAAAYGALNRLIAGLGIRPQTGPGAALHLAAAQPANPAAPLLLAALTLMQSGEWRRFKLCRDPDCRASYVDASKAAVKTWCAMQTCGSRDKMRRYRAKS